VPVKRSGLGRGLDALLPKPETGLKQIALEELSVSPFQPRKQLNPEAIAELAQSIAEKGILQPLVVRPTAEGYEIVAGERRYRAAQKLGLATVPAVVRQLSDQETLEIAIIENLQREDLNPVEEAKAFKQLMGFGLSQDMLAKAVGKSRSAVANTLRLLNLPSEALTALETGQISAGHARAILAQPEAAQSWALEQILKHNLTVRQAEQLKQDSQRQTTKRDEGARLFEALETDLARHVGTKVKVSGRDKGKLELYFYSPEELNRLLELLGYQP
jgi:ParB family chromosome partitioning protein